jgi:tRNA 2-thiouridine synthesizing protein A
MTASHGRDPDPAAPEIDARGLKCPLPVIRLAQAARQAPAGTTLTLLTTDPAAAPDVAAWCRLRGHTLLSQTPVDAEDAALRHTIRLSGH